MEQEQAHFSNLASLSKDKSDLRRVSARLMEQVTIDTMMESLWLRTLAHMEQLAAHQIRSNISAFTPDHERSAIEEHAADEDRHALEILSLCPGTGGEEGLYGILEKKLKHIAEQFVIGYFGNPLLITAKNKHAAYAHGAITIEQFPFQVYAAYLKATKLPQVKAHLPRIVREEQTHLALGRRLIEQLPEAQRLSVEKLLQIEEDMCVRMMKRMSQVIDEHFDEKEKKFSFEDLLTEFHDVTLIWASALGAAEEMAANQMEQVYKRRGLAQPSMMPAHVADEMRHAKMLRRTVLLEKRKLLARNPRAVLLEKKMHRQIKLYQLRLFSALMGRTQDPDAIYLYGALALETRVFKHYKDLSSLTNHICLSHVLSVILDEEADHTRQTSAMIKEKNLSMEDYRNFAQVEKALWEKMTENISNEVSAYVVTGSGAGQ